MKKLNLGLYAGLIVTLSVSAFIYTLLPIGDFATGLEMPASKPVMGLVSALVMLVVYGGLGWLGLFLASKNGFPPLWNASIRQNALKVSLTGVGIGVVFIITDILVNRFTALPTLPHPPFPTSIFASINAGIGEEIVFRLFFISFWVWALSKIVRSERGRGILFWIVAVFSALAFAMGHLPAIMYLYSYTTIADVPLPLMGMIVGLNGLLSMFAAYHFRKYGFLAAVLIHFWADIVWHVVYGTL